MATNDDPSSWYEDKLQDDRGPMESTRKETLHRVITEDDDDDISSSGEAPVGPSMKEKAAQEERSTLAKQESTAIAYLRWIVLFVFIIIGVAFAWATFYLVHKDQQERFEEQFHYYAKLVIDRFPNHLERVIHVTDTFSTEMTSHALATGSVFPFVTLPHSEFKGANARIGGDFVMIYYMPYITEDLKVPWETYAAANRGYYANASASEETSKIAQDKSFDMETPGLSGKALGVFEFMQGPGASLDFSTIWFSGEHGNMQNEAPYFPLWQITPHIPIDILNLDMGRFDFLNGAMHTSVDTGEIVFGTMADLTSNNDGQMNDTGTFEMLLQSGQYRHKKERYLDDPMTPMVYPVFDSFNTSRKVGGLLVIDIYWRFILTNILPRNVNGVICVVENSMGQKHTYEIRGKDAVFHNDDPPAEDKDVTSQEYVLDIVANLTRSASPESRSFTAAGINGQILNYTLRVYPSHDFTNSFPEASPQVNAITVASVFAVAIALFLVYDYFVSKRQKIVLERAVKATSVVSTLFPASIREHVINDGTHETNKQGKGRDPLLGSTAQGPSSLGSTAQGPSSHPASLAMKYSDCTVCFADLVGFTQWSSIRHPEQVFKLLKTIFKEFDAAAAWRGVFKVETIGDCYMAVTGLPNAQPDHAIIMAKFAHHCMAKFALIVENLASTLGEGANELTLRIGIHSGEVIAGVLRGEKGRFQLFGDTVNTASRMKSTGVPGKIQVSQVTADCLILGGKQHWLVPRMEKVYAKGKGRYRHTFWKSEEERRKRVASAIFPSKASLSTCAARE